MVCGAPTSCSSGGRSAVHDEQRHAGVVGLDDRRVQLDGGGAAGGEDDDRLARCRGQPEGEEAAARSSWCTWTVMPVVGGQGAGPSASSANPGRRPRGRHRRAPTRRRAWRRRWPAGPRVAAPWRRHPTTPRLPGSTPCPCTPSAGAPDRALVLLHGFTQTGRCWGPVADALAADHEVVLVDAPGHGRSADVVADLCDRRPAHRRPGGEATYVGYSMGGRFCLHLALGQPGAGARPRAARRHRRHRRHRPSARPAVSRISPRPRGSSRRV